MTATLLRALVVASGGLLSVGATLIVLMLLSSRNGLRKGAGYAVGYSLSYLSIGMLGIVLGRKWNLGAQTAERGPTIGAYLYLGLGLLLLLLAVRRVLWPSTASGPNRWLRSIDELTPLKVVAMAAMFALLNIKNLAIFLSALAILIDGGHPLGKTVLGLLLVVVWFCLSMWLPVAVYAAFSEKGAKGLAALRAFIERRKRPLTIAILFVLGTLFSWRGRDALPW